MYRFYFCMFYLTAACTFHWVLVLFAVSFVVFSSAFIVGAALSCVCVCVSESEEKIGWVVWGRWRSMRCAQWRVGGVGIAYSVFTWNYICWRCDPRDVKNYVMLI